MHSSVPRILFSAMLLAILALGIAVPARAFDGRSGDTVTIAAGETVNDDLYVAASDVVVDGTVQGDLVAVGKTITVNGTVTGDVIAAGQAVIINGTVGDDVRLAGAVLFVGAHAQIGGDVVGAAGSLESRPGSTLGHDVVFAGGQALLASQVTRNVTFAGGGLELAGTVGGDVKAAVGNSDQAGAQPAFFMPNTGITTPDVKVGLTLDPAARIAGSLNYTSVKQFSIPAGVVAGKVAFTQAETRSDGRAVRQPSPAELLANAAFDVLRRMITLILFGLLLGWLFPTFIGNNVARLKAAPLPSLGWGFVAIAATAFAGLTILIGLILGAIFFGVLTLSGIAGTVVWLGILAFFILVLGFVLTAAFIAPIIVSSLGGELILARISPALADNWIWPLIVGVVILALLGAIPVLGALINLLVLLLGLGALWFLGGRLVVRPKAAA